MSNAGAGGGSIAVCTALDAGYLPLVVVFATGQRLAKPAV